MKIFIVVIISLLFSTASYAASYDIAPDKIKILASGAASDDKPTGCGVIMLLENDQGVTINTVLSVGYTIENPDALEISTRFAAKKLLSTENDVPVRAEPKVVDGDIKIGDVSLNKYTTNTSYLGPKPVLYKRNKLTDNALLDVTSRIVLKEEPVEVTFKLEGSEEIYIFHVNPKGLVQDLYKNEHQACFKKFSEHLK
jgi:hypothetical protein